MARYRVAEEGELSHSERVTVKVPQPVLRSRVIPLLPGDATRADDVPQPTVAVGYERRDLKAGDVLELSDQDGARLPEAGIVEAFNDVPAKRRKASANKMRKNAGNKKM